MSNLIKILLREGLFVDADINEIADELDFSSFKVKKILNPEVWESEDVMNPDIKDLLIRIANNYYSSLDLNVKISDIIHKNKNNIVYGLFIFIIPQLLFRSSEIRAYTMEFLSILVSIYIIINLDKLNNKNIFLLSLISSILITSRYSSVLLFGIITLITIYYTLLISTKSFYNKFITILLFSMPLFISVCFIFFGTLIHQNPNLSKVTYMEYLNDNPLLFFKNFNWIHFVSILLLIFIAFFDQKINLPLKFFLYSAIVVNLVFILISFLGIYPYNPFDERNLAIFVYAFLPLIYWFHLKFNKYVIFLKKPFIPLFFAIIFTYTFNKVVSKNWRKNNLYTDLVNYKFSKQNIFFVEKDLIPTTRYLFEYTNLNNHLDYPNSFLFLINDSIIDETIRLKKNSNCFLISNRIIYNNKFKKVGYSLYKVN